MPSPAPARRLLGQALRDEVKASGLSRAEVQRLTGFSASKLSRVLNIGLGRQRAVRSDAQEDARPRRELYPSEEDAHTLASALGLDDTRRQRIVALARQAREERDQLVADVALTRLGETQERWARFEAASVTVRTWHPAVPPGLLQTEAYMRSVFRSLDGKPEDEVERAVAARLRRQRESRNRRCVLLAPEAVLWWGIPGAQVMTGLCDHIAELITTHPAWTVAFIPRGTRGTDPPLGLFPVSGFDLFDDRLLTIGTSAGNIHAVRQAVIDEHLAMFERLLSLALVDDAALPLLRSISAHYRAQVEAPCHHV